MRWVSGIMRWSQFKRSPREHLWMGLLLLLDSYLCLILYPRELRSSLNPIPFIWSAQLMLLMNPISHVPRWNPSNSTLDGMHFVVPFPAHSNHWIGLWWYPIKSFKTEPREENWIWYVIAHPTFSKPISRTKMQMISHCHSLARLLIYFVAYSCVWGSK